MSKECLTGQQPMQGSHECSLPKGSALGTLYKLKTFGRTCSSIREGYWKIWWGIGLINLIRCWCSIYRDVTRVHVELWFCTFESKTTWQDYTQG